MNAPPLSKVSMILYSQKSLFEKLSSQSLLKQFLIFPFLLNHIVCAILDFTYEEKEWKVSQTSVE